MNTFKRKALFAAVLAGLGAGVAYATPPPQGQHPLIYPYYTVKDLSSPAIMAPTLVHEYVAIVNSTNLRAHHRLGVDRGLRATAPPR